ncbi:MAG: hypothetical protein DMD87_29675 [Candidatus Rokuibacteriota bacterium]|nr:MAG: hypothetical protein DMD87_29675 [Candidatus Rokubacteria bacterium]
MGLFAITRHGVADGLVDDLRRRAHELFGLPLSEKPRSGDSDRRSARVSAREDGPGRSSSWVVASGQDAN